MKALLGFALGVAFIAQAVTAAAAPKGSITVRCPVDGAKVEVDGRAVGVVPLAAVPASAGRHLVRVKKLGYLEHAETVRVMPGRNVQIHADLLPFAGILKVTCNVAGAQVAVDGRPFGRAPLEQEIKIGKRVVEVTAPGYDRYSETLRVSAGAQYGVAVKLNKPGKPGSAPVADGDDLALEPIGPGGAGSAGGKAKGAAKLSGVDDLELEPLPDLALVPPTAGAGKASGKGAAGKNRASAGGGNVKMAVDPDLETIQAREVAEVAAPSATIDPMQVRAVEPAEPWFVRYWAWGAGGAAALAGGVLVRALLARDEDAKGRDPDVVWMPGVESH